MSAVPCKSGRGGQLTMNEPKPRIAHSADGKTITVPAHLSTHSRIIVVTTGTKIEVFKIADWQS